MRVLTFWVAGSPVPKARARTVRTRSGKVVSFTPKRTARWEAVVRLVAQAACTAVRWRPEPAAYEVELTVHRSRRAGDADNFAKAIGDALNGVAYPDDRSVRRLAVSLVDGQGEGVMVRISRTANELTTQGKGRTKNAALETTTTGAKEGSAHVTAARASEGPPRVHAGASADLPANGRAAHAPRRTGKRAGQGRVLAGRRDELKQMRSPSGGAS